MGRKLDQTNAVTPMQVLRGEVAEIRSALKKLRQAGTTSLQSVDIDRYLSPVHGELVFDYPRVRVCIYDAAQEEWICEGGKGFELKVFSDIENVVVGDGALFFMIPSSWDGKILSFVEAGVSAVSSSGNILIQLHRMTANVDVLSTRITIDATEGWSGTAAAPVINTAQAIAVAGEQWRVDIDSAGTNAKGLEVVVEFG